jgi:hypothetical protein
MRKLTLAAAAVISLAAATALAQTGAAVAAKSDPGKVAMAEAVRMAATVEAIDKDKRLVTLKGPEGNSFVVQAGAEVRNFDQIKVGDQVVVRYIEASGASEVALINAPGDDLAGALRARGIDAYTLGPPRQIELFAA